MVNAARIVGPGKDAVSRQERGYKERGEQKMRVGCPEKGVKKGAVPYLVDRGQKNSVVRRCLSQWEQQQGMHL